MSPENTIDRPISQKRIDANRRNSQKSTGPRTVEGKNRSRFNRLKHGLRATVPVLPGEDPAAFQARVDGFMEGLDPQNQVEADLLERVAATTWSLDRANRAESARLCQLIRNDAAEREKREREEALSLGQRLLFDARGPRQLYPHTPYPANGSQPRISWSPDPADPNNPAVLVLHLEQTVAGCRWLLDRWGELRARLEPGHVWLPCDQFKAIRLLGKQPLDAVEDSDVIQILVAGADLLKDENSGRTFAPLASELSALNAERETYLAQLVHRQPWLVEVQDADSARRVLRNLVDREISRLKPILARNEATARADAAEAHCRLAFDPSPEGDKLRRYVLSAARLVNQTIRTYLSVARCPLSVEDREEQAALESGAGRGTVDAVADPVLESGLQAVGDTAFESPLEGDADSALESPPQADCGLDQAGTPTPAPDACAIGSPPRPSGERSPQDVGGEGDREGARRQSPLICPSDIFSPRGEGAGEGGYQAGMRESALVAGVATAARSADEAGTF